MTPDVAIALGFCLMWIGICVVCLAALLADHASNRAIKRRYRGRL